MGYPNIKNEKGVNCPCSNSWFVKSPQSLRVSLKVLGATKRGDGFLEGGGYIVRLCVGHLVELAQPGKAMKNAMPNGERKTCRFCPIPGNTR